MSLADKLEKQMRRLIEIEVERTKLETQLFYDPLLHRQDRAETVEAMKRKCSELLEERVKLWREIFED